MSKSEYLITIDVDWAPDFVIDYVSDILIDKKVKATWFITHVSNSILNLRNSDLFEIGIHPNFGKGDIHTKSTQGANSYQVMENLMRDFPEATSVRTHMLLQSIPILKLMGDDFNIKRDTSLFLPYQKNIEPHKIFFYKGSKSIIRYPYFWEDSMELHNPKPIFNFNNPIFHCSGLKIFNFHPNTIYLNSSSLDNIKLLKENYKDILKTEQEFLERLINPDIGVGNTFQELVAFLSKEGNSITLNELDSLG